MSTPTNPMLLVTGWSATLVPDHNSVLLVLTGRDMNTSVPGTSELVVPTRIVRFLTTALHAALPPEQRDPPPEDPSGP